MKVTAEMEDDNRPQFGYAVHTGLTEADVRRIVRDEIRRAFTEQPKQSVQHVMTDEDVRQWCEAAKRVLQFRPK